MYIICIVPAHELNVCTCIQTWYSSNLPHSTATGQLIQVNYKFVSPNNSLEIISSDDDNPLGLSNEEYQATLQILSTNSMIIEYYQNQRCNCSTRHGGSIPGHIVVRRDRKAAHHNLFNDYFSDNPRYGEDFFRRRFRMSRSLFLRIVDAVKSHNPYFEQRTDALGRLGLSPLQKITAAFRMLAYGVPADATDEYVKIGESTVIESLKKFCRTVVEIFFTACLFWYAWN